jgi:hypothetical protein
VSGPYAAIGTLDAVVTPGESWGVDTATTQGHAEYVRQTKTYFNGYAVCDSIEPF